LAQGADDIDLQLACLEREHGRAYTSRDPARALKVVQRARDIIGLIPTIPWEYPWMLREAWAYVWMGNLPRALSLCIQAKQLLTSVGLEGSGDHLEILDLRVNVLYLKSEYLEARQLCAQTVKMTSATRSPYYHAHALCGIAELEILMEGEVTDIVSNMNAAKTVYVALDSPRVLLVSSLAAELELLHGVTVKARAAFLDCLSKSRGIFPDITESCLAALADPAHKMHGTMDNFHWALVYFAFVVNKKDAVGKLQALRCLAELYMSLEDDDTALHLFHTALEDGTKMDIHRLRAQCMVGIGDIMLRRGDLILAKKMWGAAHPLFVRASRMKDVGLVEDRLERLSLTQQNTQPFPVIEDAQVDFTAIALESFNNALPSSLEKLETMSAPNSSPSPRAKTAESTLIC
jgi:hypothetical protein